jgi:uncharacterized protein (TIGR02145 family)
MICLGQGSLGRERLPVEKLNNEISPNELKRNALYNMDEIKVRWKKAALENCPGVPCVTLVAPSSPTSVVATAGDALASVAFTIPTNNGGSVITGYTVTSNPGNITATGSSSPLTVNGLTNGTSYTFTVVATNAVGNSLASAASAAVTPAASSCSTPTITDVDGNTYHTVSIGTQCWTKENLRVTHYNDNTPIPLDVSGTSTGLVSQTWSTRNVGAYTIYGNQTSMDPNAFNFGFLYNWYAAKGIDMTGSTTYKNLCPTGFHVPTDAEWTTLTTHLGGLSVAGGKMKETGTTLWSSPNIAADNTSGFTARPGGCRRPSGNFEAIGGTAFFWSATESTPTNAWIRFLGSGSGNMTRGDFSQKSFGASVRCLED